MSNSIIEAVVDHTEKERQEAAILHPGPTEFVHLHNHTLFSPLDGIATPEEYFSAAAHLGQPAFSITDHGSIAAVPDAYWAAKKNKVKFIPGCEVYFQQKHLELVNRRKDPNFKIRDIRPDYNKAIFELEDLKMEEEYSDFRRNRHLSVLAMNMTGYRNLIHMTTEAWEIGFYYKPRVWFEQIEKYHEGLIILSGCLNGPVCHALRKSAFWGDVAKKRVTEIERTFSKKKRKIKLQISSKDAEQRRKMYFAQAVGWIQKFKALLGDRYYLELQMPGEEIPFGKEAFKQTAFLSKQLGVPGAITNDCHYLSRQDFQVQKCMMAIDQGLIINDPNLFHVNSDEQFFKSRAQLRKTFIEGGYDKFISLRKFEEYCDNTVKISERCSGFQPNLEPKLPNIKDADKKLRGLVLEALKTRGFYNKPDLYKVDGKMVTYRQQAAIEMDRYIEKGFASYFLIIRDLIQFSKNKNWDIGPGRGSAGGSLVCYLLGIHSIDPLAWGLSSVRFMGDSRGGHMLRIKME